MGPVPICCNHQVASGTFLELAPKIAAPITSSAVILFTNLADFLYNGLEREAPEFSTIFRLTE